MSAIEELRKAAAESQAQQEALKELRSWERAMQRTFKGIVTRKARHRSLQRAVDRDEG